MKKRVVFYTIVIAVLAAVAASLWQAEYGYVLVTGGDWTYERALSQSIVIGVVVFAVLYLLIGLAIKVLRFPVLMKHYRHRRGAERAHRNIIKGLIELIEGHWQKSETILLKDIDNSDTPLLNYLLAARAAQQQDANQRRDEYLKKAHETTPKADVAVGLTQAELQLAHGQTEQALATLTRLRELAPHHRYVLKLLSRLYVQLNEWEKLAALLPELRKRRIVTGDKLLQLERTTYTYFLRYVSGSSTVFNIEEQWKLLPKRYRADPEIFRVFIDCLMDSDNHPAAERHLRLFLNKNWDEQLARRYGEVELTDSSKQLDMAESWLKDHGRSPMLLLSLARLCCRLRLWGKARVYYETSIGIHATSEAYGELAELLESLGEKDSAYNALRKGMELAVSQKHNRRTSDRPLLPSVREQQPEGNGSANGTRIAANA